MSGSSASSTRSSTTSIARCSSRRSTAPRPGSSCRASSIRSSPWPSSRRGRQPAARLCLPDPQPLGLSRQGPLRASRHGRGAPSGAADGQDPRPARPRRPAADLPGPRASGAAKGAGVSPFQSHQLKGLTHVSLERFQRRANQRQRHPQGHAGQGAHDDPPGRVRRPRAGLDRRLCQAGLHGRGLSRCRIHGSRRTLCQAQDLVADRALQPQRPELGQYGPQPGAGHAELIARNFRQGQLGAGAGRAAHQRVCRPRRDRVHRPDRCRQGLERGRAQRDQKRGHARSPRLCAAHGSWRRADGTRDATCAAICAAGAPAPDADTVAGPRRTPRSMGLSTQTPAAPGFSGRPSWAE